jgi:hypothetical protein
MGAEEIRLIYSHCTSAKEYQHDNKRWEHEAERRLREYTAHTIQRDKSELIVREDMVERRLEVYVATPEVFWRIVREEAEKIAFRFLEGEHDT